MSTTAQRLSPIQRYLDELYEQLLGITEGEVASYIPELMRSDPAWLGLALVTVDGHVYQAGDSRQGLLDALEAADREAELLAHRGVGADQPCGELRRPGRERRPDPPARTGRRRVAGATVCAA